MAGNSVPQNFDWIEARAKCSLLEVFKSLGEGVRADIDNMADRIPEREEIFLRFMNTSNRSFSANRCDNPMTGVGRSIDFRVENGEIAIYFANNDGESLLFRAPITLDNAGQCKLMVNGEALEQWQVRRMALEKLLFGPPER